jgi:DNA-binding response OmpR family regulator
MLRRGGTSAPNAARARDSAQRQARALNVAGAVRAHASDSTVPRPPRSRRFAFAGVARPLRLALLDRDSGFLAVLTRHLRDLAWDHREFASAVGPEALVAMDVDAIVVDLEILGAGAWRWIEGIRSATDPPAIVVCTAAYAAADRVRALRLGADDWLPKPCHPAELIARVEAVVRHRRRLASGRAAPIVVGELEIRRAEYQAFVRGVSLALTRREFQVVDVLAREPATALRREDIFDRVWGGAMTRNDRSVDVVVHKVRRKLLDASPSWRYIHTHVPVGYSLELAPAPVGAAVTDSEAPRDAASHERRRA